MKHGPFPVDNMSLLYKIIILCKIDFLPDKDPEGAILSCKTIPIATAIVRGLLIL
jgi:hypothetical protein